MDTEDRLTDKGKRQKQRQDGSEDRGRTCPFDSILTVHTETMETEETHGTAGPDDHTHDNDHKSTVMWSPKKSP